MTLHPHKKYFFVKTCEPQIPTTQDHPVQRFGNTRMSLHQIDSTVVKLCVWLYTNHTYMYVYISHGFVYEYMYHVYKYIFRTKWKLHKLFDPYTQYIRGRDQNLWLRIRLGGPGCCGSEVRMFSQRSISGVDEWIQKFNTPRNSQVLRVWEILGVCSSVVLSFWKTFVCAWCYADILTVVIYFGNTCLCFEAHTMMLNFLFLFDIAEKFLLWCSVSGKSLYYGVHFLKHLDLCTWYDTIYVCVIICNHMCFYMDLCDIYTIMFHFWSTLICARDMTLYMYVWLYVIICIFTWICVIFILLCSNSAAPWFVRVIWHYICMCDYLFSYVFLDMIYIPHGFTYA